MALPLKPPPLDHMQADRERERERQRERKKADSPFRCEKHCLENTHQLNRASQPYFMTSARQSSIVFVHVFNAAGVRQA